MGTKTEEVQLLVHGRVQAVGFRYATVDKAFELGVVGWVRNTREGNVEILAQGTIEQLESFLLWCEKGPALARVEKVALSKRKPIDKPSFESFQLRY